MDYIIVSLAVHKYKPSSMVFIPVVNLYVFDYYLENRVDEYRSAVVESASRNSKEVPV